MKKEWEAGIAELTKDIVQKLSGLSNIDIPKKDGELERIYNTLRDTFNAFYADGSAELGYAEYVEARTFLQRPGSEKEIKQTFDFINVDGTGFVGWSEFAFSLMGEDALKFGPLADLEVLAAILEDNNSLLGGMKSDLEDAQMSTSERKREMLN